MEAEEKTGVEDGNDEFLPINDPDENFKDVEKSVQGIAKKSVKRRREKPIRKESKPTMVTRGQNFRRLTKPVKIPKDIEEITLSSDEPDDTNYKVSGNNLNKYL